MDALATTPHNHHQNDSLNTSPAAQLPDVLLANILERVPQQNRLKDAAVVCRAWARCATAATTSIDGKPPPAAKIPAFSSWLAEHGKHLRGVDFSTKRYFTAPDANSPALTLRCGELPELTVLVLGGVRIDLQLSGAQQPLMRLTRSRSSGSRPAVPGAILPKLRELRLHHCTFTSSAALLQLPPLTGVTQLELSGTPTAEGNQRSAAISNAGVQLVRCLPQLAELRLKGMQSATEVLAVVPSSLTALEIGSGSYGMLAYTAPQLAQLQKLTLYSAVLHPSMFASTPLLKSLQLSSCTVWQSNDWEEADSTFYSALRSLKQLQELQVDWEYEEAVLSWASPADCGALTASPHLTKLVLRAYYTKVLPMGAIQHMFPAGSQLPLQELVLMSCEPDMYTNGRSSCMSAADLQRLVSTCSDLRSLGLTCVLQPGDSVDVNALLQLPSSLHTLDVGGDAFGDEAAATIGQLSQLTSLDWTASSTLTDAGLDRFTALQSLQQLYLEEDHFLSEEVGSLVEGFMGEPIKLTSNDKPVWQQLQDLLAKNPGNAAWRKRMQQQEDAARREMQQKVVDLGSFMQHALLVMAHCAGNSAAVQLVQDMSRIASAVLSGSPASGGGDESGSDDGVSDGGGGDGVVEEQQRQRVREYKELHGQLLAASCGDSVASGSSHGDVRQALAAMEAIVMTASLQQ